MFTLFKKNTPKSKRTVQVRSVRRGFTLIELLAVLVIMSVITLVFFSRQSKFDSSTLMRSLAYSMALSVRQAQVYGISVRPSMVNGNFTLSHGLFFSNNASYFRTYIMYADQNTNNMYDGTPVDAVDQTFNLNGSFSITEFCAIFTDPTSGNDVRRCSGPDDSSGGASGTISTLDIMFKRPNPDAVIYAYDNGNQPRDGIIPPYSAAYIRITATDGTSRGIHIWSTGQVSVDALGAAI